MAHDRPYAGTAEALRPLKLSVLHKHSFKCWICLKPLHLKNMSIDHVVPQCCGGEDDLDNYMPACRRCNENRGLYHMKHLHHGKPALLEGSYILTGAKVVHPDKGIGFITLDNNGTRAYRPYDKFTIVWSDATQTISKLIDFGRGRVQLGTGRMDWAF